MAEREAERMRRGFRTVLAARLGMRPEGGV
jgi:hypothetical protein